MEGFNRFGNMNPTREYCRRPYLMDRPAFPIAGNLYFVGNLWCSSHLIDTGDGLILLDTPTAGSLPGLLFNIAVLGFDPRDIKYIVVSHAHTDHFGAAAARAVAEGRCDRGIVICTTGIGISIAANKIKGIRCAHCADCLQAELTRRHNNANMMAIGAGFTGKNMAERMVEVFLSTEFEGGRPLRRVDKVMTLEEG